MAQKTNRTDRRVRIEDVRKRRRGAERNRGLALVAVCAVVAVGIVVAAAWAPLKSAYDQRKYDDTVLQDIGASPSGAGCQKPFTLDSATTSNLPTDTYYTTAPPAFGPSPTELNRDDPAPVGTTFYSATDSPDLTTLVRSLDSGYTILWYDDTVSRTELDQIKAIARKFSATDDFRDKFIAAPWTAEDARSTEQKNLAHTSFPAGTHIAFTHWTGSTTPPADAAQGLDEKGDFEFCAKVSGAALKAFMRSHPYTESPDPTGA